jgi:hypothetical protein
MSEGFGEVTRHRLPWGVAGVFVWLLLFSTGVLIPSEPSRIDLGWRPLPNLETKASNPVQGGPALGTETKNAQPNLDNSIKGKKEDLAKAGPPDGSRSSKFSSFVVAMFTFTPLNVGFLCVLAAFVGGCSINKNEIHRIHQEILDLEANPPVPPNPDLARLRQRLDYLTEHPGYSTIRGLVVYLIIISGLFIIGAPLTGENGTQSVTLAQYMKLAGLFSFFGYLSGYDPTVFSSFIGLGSNHLSTGKKAP